MTLAAPPEDSAATGLRPPRHPLEPLTADEISAASRILVEERSLGPTFRFVYITLREPAKAAVLAWQPSGALDREAFVVLYERGARTTWEAVVSLTRGTVLSLAAVPDVQAPMMLEEFLSCEEVVRADPRWQEAMRRRGVEDLGLAMIDPWSSGYRGPQDAPGVRRIARPLSFIRSSEFDNGYARPVEGLIVTVDLDTMTVVEVEDHGVVPVPPRPGNYEPDLMVADPRNVPAFDRLRDDVKPIEITQPEGAGFRVDGHAVAWQKWRLQVGFTPREGLVLHQVSYDDRGRERPVIYRASLAEMFIPYGDPAPVHRGKNVFDQGEYGLGVLANSLELGCDCLGEIFYFDGVVNDQDGRPVTIPNAICMHEEDVGVGWKHTDFRTERVEVRRMRRLVISTIVTVGNYEYGFFWHLYLDGTIEFEVKLTGIISTGAIAVGETPGHGNLVAPGLYGPHHQHFFNVRLDISVDGGANSVYEVDSVRDPVGPDNPTGTGWRTRETLLACESAAQRTVDPLAGRYWKIVNPAVKNALGEPVGYKLHPGAAVAPMHGDDSIFAARAGFAGKQLWVTAYDPAERFAAGDYPNQHPGGDGLPRYAAADRPLEDTDVVLWHTFCAHHIVRPEDWPVMPVTKVGFELRPVGFFDGNPALDVPPSEPKHCH